MYWVGSFVAMWLHNLIWRRKTDFNKPLINIINKNFHTNCGTEDNLPLATLMAALLSGPLGIVVSKKNVNIFITSRSAETTAPTMR
jgi:tRNA A37 threonylcarbamoyladenosine synthetase subunit TsaC/SUA5/YrdC